jgi:hypothetical protein
MYMHPSWFNYNSTSIIRITCLRLPELEPYIILILIFLKPRYLVLKYTPEIPLFDERFVNYGYNKVQHIEQLKYFSIY